MLLALILFALSFPTMAQANTYEREALQLLRESKEKMRPYEKEALELSQEAPQKIQPFQAEVQAIKKETDETLTEILTTQKSTHISNACQQGSARPEQEVSETLIFVSLSMPQETLISLYKEAEANEAILVLRGLKEQSFKKTAEHIKALGIALQINPELFAKYQVQKVPTFVRIKDNDYDALSGNVSLQFAKQKFLEANR